MVSYNSVLHEAYREFFCEPNNSPLELGAAEQLPISAAASSNAGALNEVNVNSLLLAALEQFEEQATNQLLLFALEGYKNYTFLL